MKIILPIEFGANLPAFENQSGESDVSLVSVASGAWGLKEYIKEHKPEDEIY